jgi:hypothetical protein
MVGPSQVGYYGSLRITFFYMKNIANRNAIPSVRTGVRVATDFQGAAPDIIGLTS